MKTSPRRTLAVLFSLVVALVVSGCEPPPSQAPAAKQPNRSRQPAVAKQEEKTKPATSTGESRKDDAAQAAAGAATVDEPPMQPARLVFKEPPPQDGWKRTRLAENVWLETKGEARRVLVGSLVCLREGAYGLECLLCKRGTKEHESILVTTADARFIHAALEAAKMSAGSPVQFEPKFAPPTGDKVKITLLFEQKRKWVTVPAQKMILNAKTRKDLTYDWVFAGSRLYKNPDDPKADPIYLANNDGAYISISNVLTSVLDLPIDSPRSIENRIYEPNTGNIPPLDTSVTIILEPAGKKK